MKQYAMKWDLESIFTKKTLNNAIQHLETQITEYRAQKLPLTESIIALQILEKSFSEIFSYIECLLVQDVCDQDAVQKKNQIVEIRAQLDDALLHITDQLVSLTEEKFEQLVQCPSLEPITYYLQHNRARAKKKAPLPIEEIFLKLSSDGFHSWFGMYQELIGSMRIRCSIDDEEKELSSAEADNYLAHADRSVREEVFSAWQKACHDEEMKFTRILNHISGFRLQLCKERNQTPLMEALHTHNMDEETLYAMWKAVRQVQDVLRPFYEEKAKICNVKKLSWYDLEAPCSQAQRKYCYHDLAQWLPEQFSALSSDMATFVERAFCDQWLDVEIRKNKAPGGFCTPFPDCQQSRIYLNYMGTFHNDLVVAHELGHAYHNHVVYALPFFSQHYPMSLAEMASTFFEHVLFEARLSKELLPHQKKVILFEKIQRHSFLLQNIYARFLFEQELYERRSQGFLLPKDLCDIMTKAQREAYGDVLEEYHPYFWITKVHFSLTDVSFYNFPYTVGYLLSLLLTDQAKHDRENFSKKYQALLLDSGRKSVRDIISEHFQGDSSGCAFWQQAIQLIHRDVEEYVTLLRAVS